MKRSGTRRLLTSGQMEKLIEARLRIDKRCVGCGNVRSLDAHHVLPQSIIKAEYYHRGGVAEGDRFRPLTRFEFWREPDVTANQIAADVETVVCLCRACHALVENANYEGRHLYLLPEAPQIVAVANKYSLTRRMERHYGKEIWDAFEAEADRTRNTDL